MSEYNSIVDRETLDAFHDRCFRAALLASAADGEFLQEGLRALCLGTGDQANIIVEHARDTPGYGDAWKMQVHDIGFGWSLELYDYEYPVPGDSIIQTHHKFFSFGPVGDGRSTDSMFAGPSAQANIYGSTWQEVRPKVFTPVTMETFVDYLDSPEGASRGTELALGVLGLENDVVPTLQELTKAPVTFGPDTLELIDDRLGSMLDYFA